jgi:hypothetical protein
MITASPEPEPRVQATLEHDPDSWALVVHRVAHDRFERHQRTVLGREIVRTSTFEQVTDDLRQICANPLDPFCQPPAGLT